MKTYPECVTCLFNQVIHSQHLFGLTDDQTREIMNTFARELPLFPLPESPPVLVTVIQHELESLLGTDDPYRPLKEKSSQRILDHIDEIREVIEHSGDPLKSAVLLAIGGNAIDYGVFGPEVDVEKVIRDALSSMESADAALHSMQYDEWFEHLKSSSNIFYLADNAGEIVFDRLLIETIRRYFPWITVSLGVRNRPILNDVTRRDAVFAGIDQVAQIIESEADSAGVLVGKSGEVFRNTFLTADMIISKGQANYETLDEQEGPIFFFLKVKCPVVAERTGKVQGTYLLMKAPAFR